MITPADYKDVMNQIPLGGTRKVPHLGCSESNAMKIWHNVEGYRFKCFKCGSTAFHSMFNSPRERLKRQQTIKANREAETDPSYGLPVDFSQNMPMEALQWLGSGGWTLAMMKQYNIGWSGRLSRVILPVSSIGYTARSVHSWLQPKYLERVPAGSVWESHSAGQPNACVLCEDILSAGRCGEYMKAYSLLGTSLDTKILNILKKYKTIVVWLDPDRGGISGVKSMYRRLHLVCDDVCVIHSKVDPKCMPDNEIKEILYTRILPT